MKLTEHCRMAKEPARLAFEFAITLLYEELRYLRRHTGRSQEFLWPRTRGLGSIASAVRSFAFYDYAKYDLRRRLAARLTRGEPRDDT